MRILFIIPEEFRGDRWGGVTTYVVELSRALQDAGHDVSVLTPGRKKENFRINQVKFYKIPLYDYCNVVARIGLKLLRKLMPDIVERICWASQVSKFIQNSRYDIVEAPEWGSSTLFISSDIKKVIRLHKSWYMYKKDNKLPISVNEVVLDIFERWCIVSASAVTSPTKFMASQYPFLTWILRVRKVPVSIIPYGFKLSKLYDRVRKQPSEPYILSVGRIETGKGCVLLADAFIHLYKQYNKLRLVFVGEDANMFIKGKWVSCISYIRAILPRLAQDRVHFVRKQTREALRTYYRNCLFYVAPSYGHENPSIALLEALSFGKAAIGSDTGGIPEVLHHTYNGLIFHEGDSKDLEDKIRFMLNHRMFRQRCERRSLSQRYIYDIRLTAQQTLKLYSTI